MNERIRLLRKKLGLTQQEFADRLNIKRGAIANYEIGRNVPIDAVISLICREFNVNEAWIRNGSGEMFVEMSSIEKSYHKFGNIMENASPTKVATLSMLIELVDRLPDEEWGYIMQQYIHALQEVRHEEK